MRAAVETTQPAGRLTVAELRARWRRLDDDPFVAAIPYKLELNERGSIEVSPAGPRHALLQAFVARELHRLLPAGSTFTECSVETEIGVRVPDVVWASADFLSRHPPLDDPFASAPELCVEVLSRSNTRVEIAAKVAAYLAAGAREVWLVDENRIEIIGREGPRMSSELGIELVLPR